MMRRRDACKAPELDKLFVCVDHELPDHAQLEQIARGVAAQDGEHPDPEELPRMIDAAKGLTRREAESAYSLSLVRHDTLKSETLWEIKAGQLKKSGLVSIRRGTESMDQLGGLGDETGRPTRWLRVLSFAMNVKKLSRVPVHPPRQTPE